MYMRNSTDVLFQGFGILVGTFDQGVDTQGSSRGITKTLAPGLTYHYRWSTRFDFGFVSAGEGWNEKNHFLQAHSKREAPPELLRLNCPHGQFLSRQTSL